MANSICSQQKYRRKPHHKKKKPSQKKLAKVSWRVEKKILKDKSKRLGIVGIHSDGVPPWMKRLCNKKHRQWERKSLRKRQYDTFGKPNHKRKDIFDPWMWF